MPATGARPKKTKINLMDCICLMCSGVEICNFWRLSVRIRQKLIFLRHVNRRDWAQLVQGMMGIMLSIK